MVGCVGGGDSHCVLEEAPQSRVQKMLLVVKVKLRSQTREQTPSGFPPEDMNETVGRPVRAGLTGVMWTWDRSRSPLLGHVQARAWSWCLCWAPWSPGSELGHRVGRTGFIVGGRYLRLDNTGSKVPSECEIGHRLSQDLQSSVTFY